MQKNTPDSNQKKTTAKKTKAAADTQMKRSDRGSDPASSAVEGEGSSSGARKYDEEARDFAKSGAVEESARTAKDAIDGPQRGELEEAERTGKSGKPRATH